ncbi:hypothetical protein A2368_03315 [Candidatus Collierbacteria bacterium RIFOXYB1_FULL_49_13]|uniref:Uncharacterized protein n=1 Tax=Candidatus Collierbacteria bacterium RIFOXYB1_FULL_49_13 TaxID=1817728 RepID=A0A1F5FH08_9BACT|nr:MAG: hypothetical protein A2368_03315 [Candidatus Collierbacteria bacterium RIFOXYB1_FULL_49_13]
MKVYGIEEGWRSAKKWRYDVAKALQPALSAYSENPICDHCKFVKWYGGKSHPHCYHETHLNRLVPATETNYKGQEFVEVRYDIGMHHYEFSAWPIRLHDRGILMVRVLNVRAGQDWLVEGSEVFAPLSCVQVYSA